LALMPAFDVACALLVVAGALKLWAPASTRQSLALAGVRAAPSAVRLLGLAEVALGAAAAWRPGPATAGAVAVAYLGFTAFTVRLSRVAGPADCGCFGGAEAAVGPIHVGLNAVGCVLAAAAAISPPPGLAWIANRSVLIAVPLVLGTLAAMFAAYLAFTALPVAWGAYGGGR
jgi:hypothetical protein